MSYYKLLLISLLFSQSCVGQSNLDDIIIDNIVNNCIKIKINKIENYSNALLLDTSWDIINNTGSCGCKSALLKYDVKTINSNEYITHGLFSTLNRQHFKFVINTDNSIFKNAKYNLIINCSN